MRRLYTLLRSFLGTIRASNLSRMVSRNPTRNDRGQFPVGEGSRSDPSSGWFDVKPVETVLAARAHVCALRAFWRERVARNLMAAQPLANQAGWRSGIVA